MNWRSISMINLKDYQARNDVFRSLAGYMPMRIVTWQADGRSQGLFSEFVTGTYFSTLGLHATQGRYFLPEEDGTSGAHAVAVMNYGTWQTRFGGATDIVGRELRLNGVVVTIIGVAPPGFIGVNGLVGPDVWLPVAMAEQLLSNEMPTALRDRSKPLFQVVGRLKPGVAATQAQANMTTLATALSTEYPSANEGRTATVRPIRDVMFGGGSTTILFASAVLVIVVGIVLLIACSNVANLLLARSAARQQEMAVRVALGASRQRLVRQLLTESMCLGLLSGVLGLVVAYVGMQLLARTLPSSGTFVSPKLDVAVLVFALVISLATGVIFGIIPAFQASRANVVGALKEAARTGRSQRRISLANTLLVGQVALSFLLLVTAALFLRSIQRAYEIDPGFQTTHLAVFVLNPWQAGYGEPQTRAFYKDVRERVANLPGVESVSWAKNMPLWARPVSGLQVEGRPQRSRTDNTTTIVNTVDRNYFETAGVVIERGREFTQVDQQTSIAVAIVNEKLAQDYWPGGDALGKRIQMPGETEMRQIVGIARTANYSSWAEPPQRCVYLPLEQNHSPAMTLYLRTKSEPEQMLNPVSREVAAVAPQALLSGMRTGRQIIDGGLFQARIGVALYGVGATDPVSLAGAAAMLVGAALLACYLPARWATRVDPLVALREA